MPGRLVDASAILRAFADVTPKREREGLDVTSAGPFLWLGTRVSFLREEASVPPGVDVSRLASIDALHANDRLLREGWVFLAGRATIDGKEVRICTPLLWQPVRVRRQAFGRQGFTLSAAGDVHLTSLVDDPRRAAHLETQAEFGRGAFAQGEDATTALVQRLPRLHGWIKEVVAAAGFDPPRLLGAEADPMAHRDDERLVAVVGTGVFVSREVTAIDLVGTLRNWSGYEGLDGTAFRALYDDPPPGRGESDDEAAPTVVRSPLPLTERQADVVRMARRETITVVSGPPGTGKSHVVAAVATDAVARGRSVLVATQSEYAAEVLGDLLARYPGPSPVLFGDAERRRAMAKTLADGLPPAPRQGELRRLEAEATEAERRVARLESLIGRMLEREAQAHASEGDAPVVPMLSGLVPGAFDPETDVAAALERVRALEGRQGWWSRRKRARLRSKLRASTGVTDDEMTSALEVATRRRAAIELATTGGTVIGELWAQLLDADARMQRLLGELVDAQAKARASASRSARRSVSGLAGALRSSRARRREALRKLDAGGLVVALPLWIGTLADIDDLLPAHPGLFDLVILDEASQIDQRYAAPALLRARRAVVVGDPRQLRHVSFVADVDLDAALAQHDVGHLADRLDVRRLSAFDAAAGRAPVVLLDEHFRSVPHLIGFSLDRFYGEPIGIATRHPANETSDAIDIVRVDGRRDGNGVNAAEVDAVRRLLLGLVDDVGAARSVGIVSPFRAQADALERMVLDCVALEVIERLGLRVGTVHGFQGHERDVMITSLAVGAGEPAGGRRFAENPNLFNVLVTRAKARMVVVTSLPEGDRGLIGAYLSYAGGGLTEVAGGATDDRWTRRLADELIATGLPVRRCYPAGRWEVDLCVGDGAAAVAVETRVHKDGPAAHIARRRQLSRSGWRIVEAYPTAYDGDALQAALTIAAAR